MKASYFLVIGIILSIILQNVNSWCLKTQFTDTEKITSIDFSRDGSKFVTTSTSNRVIVWDAHTIEQLFVYDVGVNANSAKFSKDNSMIAIGFAGANIHVLRVAGYTTITTTLNSGQGLVYEVDFNQNTTKLISCGQAQYTNAYSISGTTFTLQGNSGNKNAQNMCCKFSKNLALIAMGDKQADCYIMDYNNGGFAGMSIRDRQSIYMTTVDWNQVTNQAYFGGMDKNLYIFSSAGNKDKTYPIGKQIYTVSVSEDGGYAAVGGQDGPVYLYNVVTKNSQYLQFTLTQSTNHVTASAFSPDGQYLITGNDQGMMYMYKRICSGCPAGRFANGSVCASCNAAIPGCYLCSNASICSGCSNGYYLGALSGTSQLCKPCFTQMTGCNQCSDISTCISCVQGFFLNTGTSKCNACWDSITGCTMCNASNYCFSCDYRYYLNTTSNTCVTCTNITNCLACNASNYCMQCVQGYYQNGSGGCTQCTKNCSYCINGTYCTQCDNSFYLNTGICALCTVKGCLSCNSTNYCFDCIESMWESAGTCTFCTPPCLECSTTATTCQNCIVGYYISGTSCITCTGITQGCIGCKGAAATDCLACATGYYLNAGLTCSQCSVLLGNCAECNSTLCTMCKLGFYYDSTVPSCKLCSQGCITCVDATVCLSCQVGYFYTSAANTCTQCSVECASCQSATVCFSCNPKYYFNTTNQNCTKCSLANCITCKDVSTCLTCIQGYFPDSSGTICRACSANITNCLSCYNQSYCKSCVMGFYLSAANTTCSQCTSPCSTCDAIDCFTCDLGYYLTTVSPKTCQSCAKECAECISTTNCSKCVPGYYLDIPTDKCLTCQNIKAGCQNCNDTVCFTCKLQLGYFYNSTDNTCPQCSVSITNCLMCESNTNCTVCKYGYVLSVANASCSNCFTLIPNCQHCLDTSNCQTCLKGYYVDINQDCQICTSGCATCNDTNNCQICLRQYVLQPNFSCKLCQNYLMGCQMCRYNPTIQCTNCINGFYLTGTTCTICSTPLQGCTMCNDSLTCLSCASGYYHSATNKCFLCSSNRPNCQLCNYNTGTSLVDCIQCNQGYFLNSSSQCEVCTDTGCLSCSNSTACTRCQTGFYLSTGDCLKCQNLFVGCRLCNATDCLQCGSGFYLNPTHRCTACSLQGCQICSQLNPTTKCLVCNSQYYLTATETCQLCRVPISNCLECASNSICQICESGYYIKPDGKCALCSSKFDGCSLCTPSECLQCESGYLLNSSSLCELCNVFIPGCSFCLSSATCLSCQSGYFAQNNTCYRCSSITGCLQCQNSTTCIFCDYGYYINSASCLQCSTAIQNCVACASSSICTACLGNYILSGGSCNQLKGQSYPNYTDVKLTTQYVSATELKHTLKSIGKKIYQIDLNWTVESKFYLLDENYTEITLTIKRTQFGDKGYSLIFYTNNPLGTLTDLNSMNAMPLLGRRRLQQMEYSEQEESNNQRINNHRIEDNYQLYKKQDQKTKRLLTGAFSFDNRFKTKMQMTEQGFNSLFPDIHHTGTFYMKYKLSQPQFYRSIVNNQTYFYNYFGLIISIILVILYFSKSMIFAVEADDKGQIIPHILCYKMMGFVIYPLYGEYLDYCEGFTLLDFPWLNEYLSTMMTIDTQVSPDSFKLFYNNLNLPSTFLFAVLVIIACYATGYMMIKYIFDSSTKAKSFSSYIYNLFIAGLTISTFLSLQGAYYNPVDSISVNSLFYIIGIGLFVAIVLQAGYSIYKGLDQNVIPFNKPRIILKCMALSLAYLNPLYIFMSLIFLDICLLIVEYILKRQKKVTPKLWLFNNILVDIGLCLMMLGPYSLITIYLASLCIVIVLGIDIYIMIKQNAQLQQIRKVKVHQKQLLKAMQTLQKQSLSARSKNHQIYFKNKVIQDFQQENNHLNPTNNPFNSTNNPFNHTTSTANPLFNSTQYSLDNQDLFFQEKQDNLQNNRQFGTIAIQQDQNQQNDNYDEEDLKAPDIISPKRRTVKANLRGGKNAGKNGKSGKKKQQTMDWNLQEDNNGGTFILGNFQ